MNCPTCGSENPPEAEYCTNCGVPLSDSDGRPEAGEPVVYCTSCGSENARWATSCASCGDPLQALPAERGGTSPASESDAHPYYPSSGYTLTTGIFIPRNLDGLLGETFRIYRGNFLCFYFIVLVSQIPSLLGQVIPMPLGVSILFLVAGFMMSFLAAGAAVYAVAAQYMGRPTTIGQCYARAWNRVLSLLGSTIFFILALVVSAVLAVIIVGIPLFFYVLVRWFFYTEAIIIEGKRGPMEALGRSYGLVRGSWWRVFGIGVVFVVLFLLATLVATIPGSIAIEHNSIVGNILFTVLGSIVTPILLIGSALVYLDLRIRNEAYTLGTMASEVEA